STPFAVTKKRTGSWSGGRLIRTRANPGGASWNISPTSWPIASTRRSGNLAPAPPGPWRPVRPAGSVRPRERDPGRVERALAGPAGWAQREPPILAHAHGGGVCDGGAER